ncbi:hypothetical protein H113_08705 [Trichophyton rubrum MR1459]|nr:hypothetical protein H113_08705 [Trichophyton rubrum MR1459]
MFRICNETSFRGRGRGRSTGGPIRHALSAYSALGLVQLPWSNAPMVGLAISKATLVARAKVRGAAEAREYREHRTTVKRLLALIGRAVYEARLREFGEGLWCSRQGRNRRETALSGCSLNADEHDRASRRREACNLSLLRLDKVTRFTPEKPS